MPDTANILKCRGCGANLPLGVGTCEYCGATMVEPSGRKKFDNRRNRSAHTLRWEYKTDHAVESVCITADGSRIAAGDWDKLYFFNQAGELLWSRETGPGADGVSVAMDKAGKYIAATGGSDEKTAHKDACGGVFLFNRLGDLLWRSRSAGAAIRRVVVCADGSRLAAVDLKTIYYFNMEGTLLWRFKTKGGWLDCIDSIAISDDGLYVVAAIGARVYLLDGDGTPQWVYKDSKKGFGAVLSAGDASWVTAVHQRGWPDPYGKVLLFDRQGDLQWQCDLDFGVDCLAAASGPDGLHWAAAGGTVCLLDRRGELAWVHDNTDKSWVESVAVSDKGGDIVAVCENRKVYFFSREGALLWDYKLGRSGGEPPIRSLAVSSDASFIVATAGRRLCCLEGSAQK